MSVMPRPRVTIEPVNDGTDADRLLTAVEDMIERSNVLKRDGVVLSVEQPATDGGLAAFQQSPTSDPAPKPEPEPADDCDGLQAVAASVSAGFTTTQAREDRNGDRVVSVDRCSRCGADYDGEGVCEECRSQGDVLDDHGLRTIGSSGGPC